MENTVGVILPVESWIVDCREMFYEEFYIFFLPPDKTHISQTKIYAFML